MNEHSLLNHTSSGLVMVDECYIPQLYPSRSMVEAIAYPSVSRAFRLARKRASVPYSRAPSDYSACWNADNSQNKSPTLPSASLEPSPLYVERSTAPATAFAAMESVQAKKPPPYASAAPSQCSSSLSSSRRRMLELEVSPGQYLPLYGSDETLDALEAGNLVPCHCISCTAPLYCIDCAAYVLCPACHVLSPVEARSMAGVGTRSVGLGMSAREYHAWNHQQQQDQYLRYARRY